MATYSDLSLTFKKHPSTSDIIRKTDVDVVKQALAILFLTNKGEKLFDPEFGIGLSGMLFENMSQVSKMTLLKNIVNQVSFYEPRAAIEDVKIRNEHDSNSMFVDFYFYVKDNPNLQTLSLTFERLR